MMLKISDTLHLLAPHLPASLVPAEHFARMLRLTETFPLGLTRCFGFECRLDPANPGADFLFSTTRPERKSFLSRQPQMGLPQSVLENPLWARIASFSRAWATPDSDLHRRVLMLWYEFDVAELSRGQADPLHAPGFFFGTKDAPDDCAWIFTSALPILSGGRLPAVVEKTFRRVLGCLPPGAFIYQIGGFYARQIPHMRACITGIAPEAIPGYLRAIGCPADFDALEQSLRDLSPLAAIHLDVDIAESVGAKVGLECSLEAKSPLEQARREVDLLGFLRRGGLLDPTQMADLLGYGGFQDAHSSSAWLDVAQDDGSDRQREGFISAIRRDLSHVKLVFQPEKPVQAKAYLQAVHEWLPPLAVMQYSLYAKARSSEITRLLQSTPESES